MQALVRIRERKKSYFDNTRRAIPVADVDEDEELSNAVVEDINVEAANNASQHALHCALQLQPAYTCLLWTLHYPSMPWSFRDSIIFFAVNGNY